MPAPPVPPVEVVPGVLGVVAGAVGTVGVVALWVLDVGGELVVSVLVVGGAVVAVEAVVGPLDVGVLEARVVTVGHWRWDSAATVWAPWAMVALSVSSMPDRELAEVVSASTARATAGQFRATSAADTEFNWSLSVLA